VNLTPIQQHASINRLALEAGRNVWCEKPIATDLREAQELLSLAIAGVRKKMRNRYDCSGLVIIRMRARRKTERTS
jgi:hypothetical protein